MNKIEITGKTLNDAVDAACAKFGVGINDIDWEVLEVASKGFLGIGAKPYKIIAWKKADAESEAKAKKAVKRFEPKAAYEKEAKPEPKAAVKPEPKAAVKPEQKAAVKPEPKAEEPVAAEISEEENQSERANLTDEDKAVIIKTAVDFLKEVLGAINMDVELDAYFTDNKQIIIDMKGDDMGAIIGKRGQTLDSLQYLTNLVVNRGEYPYMNVTLDTEGYRARRKETLEHLAFNLAKKAKHNRRNVNLEPMNPYERRIIHATLQNDRYVTTYSEGVEPYRYVVIALKNNYSSRKYRY